MVQTSTVVTASIATAATGFLAYAVYFDYQRRNSVAFRRNLRRIERQQARAQKEQAEASTHEHKKLVLLAVQEAIQEGFPSDVSEREAYFVDHVAKGETLSADLLQGTNILAATAFDAAIYFYKALKVYPTPMDLIRIYDQTVPKPILDIVAEMIAVDATLDLGLGAKPAAAAASAAAAAVTPSQESILEPVEAGEDEEEDVEVVAAGGEGEAEGGKEGEAEGGEASESPVDVPPVVGLD